MQTQFSVVFHGLNHKRNQRRLYKKRIERSFFCDYTTAQIKILVNKKPALAGFCLSIVV